MTWRRGQSSTIGALFFLLISVEPVSQEAAECSRTIAEKGPHLVRAPGETQSSSTNTPSLHDRVWPPRSAAGSGNKMARALSAIKKKKNNKKT